MKLVKNLKQDIKRIQLNVEEEVKATRGRTTRKHLLSLSSSEDDGKYKRQEKRAVAPRSDRRADGRADNVDVTMTCQIIIAVL